MSNQQSTQGSVKFIYFISLARVVIVVDDDNVIARESYQIVRKWDWQTNYTRAQHVCLVIFDWLVRVSTCWIANLSNEEQEIHQNIQMINLTIEQSAKQTLQPHSPYHNTRYSFTPSLSAHFKWHLRKEQQNFIKFTGRRFTMNELVTPRDKAIAAATQFYKFFRISLWVFFCSPWGNTNDRRSIVSILFFFQNKNKTLDYANATLWPILVVSYC